MSIMGSQKRGLNIVDLRSLISNNPRASASNKHSHSQGDGTPTIRSQSDSLNEQLSSESQDELQRNFFFPKMLPSESNTPKLNTPKDSKNDEAFTKFSDLQRTRKTIQDHDDAIQKLTSTLSGVSEDIKSLRSEVKSLKAEVKYCCDHQKESADHITLEVTSVTNNTTKLSTTLDKILTSQEVLQSSLSELAAIVSKNTCSNFESILRKKFMEQQQHSDKTTEGLTTFFTEQLDKKVKSLQQEIEATREMISIRNAEEDECSSSFDDLSIDVPLGQERVVSKKRRTEE